MKKLIMIIPAICLNFMVHAQWIQSTDIRFGMQGVSATMSKAMFLNSSVFVEGRAWYARSQ